MDYDESIAEAYDITENTCANFYKEKCKMIVSLLEGKKILEAGCGTGSLFKFLLEEKFEVTGADYSEKLLDTARKKNLPIKLFQADLTNENSWKKYECSFDSVVSSEVLEHIDDDLKALQIMYSVLKPNGTLVLDTPAFNFLYSPLDKKIGHYRRYTKKTLQEVLEKAGFEVEEIRYWNLIGFFGWLISFKLLKKNFSTIDRSWIGNLLGAWLKLESKITMPLGLTVLVKARKLKK
jgi:SAM-dependent methyltransferase